MKESSRHFSPELRQHSANGFAAGAAAALVTESDELLDPLAGIDLGRVQIAVGIDADLVEPIRQIRKRPSSSTARGVYSSEILSAGPSV